MKRCEKKCIHITSAFGKNIESRKSAGAEIIQKVVRKVQEKMFRITHIHTRSCVGRNIWMCEILKTIAL